MDRTSTSSCARATPGGPRSRRPTGARAPASRPAYPLRAKINTARALKDSFATFEDAGSGLAGAIVKGGETQLFLVSSRTTVGTAPASTSVFEDLLPRLPAPAGQVHAAVIPPEVPELVVLLALVVIAAMFAAIELTRTKGQDLIAWAILALALAVLWDRT